MCLETKANASRFTTNKDIVCYKVLRKGFLSEYEGFSYVKGKLNVKVTIKLVPSYSDINLMKIYQGYHSYKNFRQALGALGVRQILVKCVIPKGTVCYTGINHDNTEGYASETIIVKRKITLIERIILRITSK